MLCLLQPGKEAESTSKAVAKKRAAYYVMKCYVYALCRNGPTGSAVCVFTFDEKENDVGTVFDGDYLKFVPPDQWMTKNIYQPFTVSVCLVVL